MNIQDEGLSRKIAGCAVKFDVDPGHWGCNIAEQPLKRRKLLSAKNRYKIESNDRKTIFNSNKASPLSSEDGHFEENRRCEKQESKQATDMVFHCPEKDSRQISLLARDNDGIRESLYDNQNLLQSPTFRPAFGDKIIKPRSPTGVNKFESSDAYSWQRSLAWSDDDDDDDDDDDTGDVFEGRTRAILCNDLALPQRLGKEFQDTIERVPPTTREKLAEDSITEESPSDFFASDSYCGKITCIHWEEKVFDATDLEKFANLRL